MLRFCKNCGLLVPHDAHSCPQCGAPVPPAACTAPQQCPAQPLYDTPDRDEDAAVTAMSQSATAAALILFAIPLVGLVLSLVWSFGGTRNPARQRLARAYLIRTTVVAVAFAVFLLVGALVLGAVLHAGLTYYYANPYFW